DRVLTSEEIAKNAALDQKRYLSPPTVTIGGKACTEVIVLSKNILMCRVPEGTTKGDNQVKLNGAAYASYKYVDPDDDFYISSISPITGPLTGATLTLKGNKLDEIDSIEVDGIPCQPPTVKISGEYKCVLPAHAAGEVDIVITTGGETYRFAKVFEYQ
ncbi:MAG: IPT/TIG domain-containing protein, partial [Candidatus Symbiothrix sp.]|nr:IPT/TIG domain-containing protein [Candidatus Symbiothrix sp.]